MRAWRCTAARTRPMPCATRTAPRTGPSSRCFRAARATEPPLLTMTGPRAFAVSAVLVLALAAAPPQAQQPAYDLLIRNARIVDGTGSPWYRGDVAVRGDTIVRIAPRIDGPATRVDRRRRPGRLARASSTSTRTRAAASSRCRRPTTTSAGRDDAHRRTGRSVADSARAVPGQGRGDAHHAELRAVHRPGVGARAWWSARSTARRRPPRSRRCERIVARGWTDGAFGLSSGLFYVPGTFTPTEEVDRAGAGRRAGWAASTSRTCARRPRVLRQRARDDRHRREGRPADADHAPQGHRQGELGRSADTLRMVDEARARGVDATIDQYPYTASATSIQAALLPAWAHEGGREATLERLKDPATRAKIKAESAPDHPRRARRRRSEERLAVGVRVGSARWTASGSAT